MAYPKPLPKRRGVFHKNTRIAFGSNGHRMHLQEQMLRHKAQYGCAVSCFGSRFAFSKQVAMNDAYVIRRLLLPLSPKIENLWGPHIQNNAERTKEFLPQRERSERTLKSRKSR